MAKCSFCGKEFSSMVDKILHQDKSCEEMPRTKT